MEQRSKTKEKKPVEEIIIELLKQGEKRGSELFKAVEKEGWSKTNFYYHLNKLIEKGVVEIVKKEGREGIYKLKERKEGTIENEEAEEVTEVKEETIQILKRLFEGDYKPKYKFMTFERVLSMKGSFRNNYVRSKIIELLKDLSTNKELLNDKYFISCIKSILLGFYSKAIEEKVDLNWLLEIYEISKDLLSKVINNEISSEIDSDLNVSILNFVYNVYILTYENCNQELKEKIFEEIFSLYWTVNNDLVRSRLMSLLEKMNEFKDKILEECFKRLKDEKYEELAYRLISRFMG